MGIARRARRYGESGSRPTQALRALLLGPALLLHNLVLLLVADRRPFPPTDDFPFVADLEAAWPIVRAEVDHLLAEGPAIPPYLAVDPAQKRFWQTFSRVLGRFSPVSESDAVQLSRWRTFVLRTYGVEVVPNARLCPATSALLDSIPGVTGAMFSIMRPGVRIPPHAGLFVGAVRVHLGVRIPAGDRTGITVAGRTRYWHEGEAFVFEHSRWHTAWNDSDEERVILIVDVERPLRNRWLARVNHRLIESLRHTEQVQAIVASIEALEPDHPSSA